MFQNHIKRLNKRLIFKILFFTLNLGVYSQETQVLSDRKVEIRNEIEALMQKLDKQKEKKNSELKQLEILTILLKKQDLLISKDSAHLILYEDKIKIINDSLNDSIYVLNIKTQERQSEIKQLKESYTSLIYQTYLLQKLYSKTSFFLSVKNLNELYKRNNYLDKLKSYRSQQIFQIKKKTEDLTLYTRNIQFYMDSIKLNLKALQENIEKLNLKRADLKTLKYKQELMIKNIQRKEETYINLIEKKNKETKQIETEIKRIIEEEKERDKIKLNKSLNSSIEIKKNLEISVNFKNNMGKMPWPVSGVIINSYGRQNHKAISGVETINNGVDFSTYIGEKCTPVFPGKISRIFFIKGKGITILIKHGEYYTLYSGLENVNVELGQNVNLETVLGTVVTSKTSSETELHFEIWKGKETQNPVKWLKLAY